MGVNLDISGVKELADSFRELSQKGAINDFIDKEIRVLGAELQKKCIEHTPVDTGALRQNWSLQPPEDINGGKSVTLENDKFYASYVNDGHRTKLKEGWGWYEGQHFMESAVQEFETEVLNESRIGSDIEKFLEEHLNGSN